MCFLYHTLSLSLSRARCVNLITKHTHRRTKLFDFDIPHATLLRCCVPVFRLPLVQFCIAACIDFSVWSWNIFSIQTQTETSWDCGFRFPSHSHSFRMRICTKCIILHTLYIFSFALPNYFSFSHPLNHPERRVMSHWQHQHPKSQPNFCDAPLNRQPARNFYLRGLPRKYCIELAALSNCFLCFCVQKSIFHSTTLTTDHSVLSQWVEYPRQPTHSHSGNCHHDRVVWLWLRLNG